MKKVMREILSTGLYLLIVLCLTYLVIAFVGQRTEVNGGSMEPTLSDEDNLIVDKITYRFSDPERFDIIVFPFKYKEKTYYIKRIIGLPGETVQIDQQGNIYIDGEILHENYGKAFSRTISAWPASPSRWGTTNILCWGTIATTVRTAGCPKWGISNGTILSAEHGFVSGPLINSAC